MAEVRVRNLDDWVVGWFRSQAKQHGQSLEGELRQTLYARYAPVAALGEEANTVLRRALADEWSSGGELARRLAAAAGDAEPVALPNLACFPSAPGKEKR